MTQQWKLVPFEPTQPMLDGMTTERKKGNGVLQMWFEALAAAPAPSACGNVETIGRVMGAGYDSQNRTVMLEIGNGDFPFARKIEIGTDLVDRAHITRLQAEVSALQQRLNIADQHVSDLEVEVAKLRRGPCELIYGDELPNQGIPGTSFQRLNALANEGE